MGMTMTQKILAAHAGLDHVEAGQLIEALSHCKDDVGAVLGDYNPAVGAWIRFNPLDGHGCKNDNVTEFRFALVESDDLELGRQNAIIRQYVKLFDLDHIKLTFDEEVFEYIVDKAIEFKLGARGLRSIVETIMIDAMYEIPSTDKKEFVVTKEYAQSQLKKANFEMIRQVN